MCSRTEKNAPAPPLEPRLPLAACCEIPTARVTQGKWSLDNGLRYDIENALLPFSVSLATHCLEAACQKDPGNSVPRQLSSVTQSCRTLCDPVNCSVPGLPVHHRLPELTQTHIHSAGDAILPSHPLASPSPPAFNLSQHQGLFKGSVLIRWPKYWSFSFSISPFNEYSRLTSFKMD